MLLGAGPGDQGAAAGGAPASPQGHHVLGQQVVVVLVRRVQQDENQIKSGQQSTPHSGGKTRNLECLEKWKKRSNSVPLQTQVKDPVLLVQNKVQQQFLSQKPLKIIKVCVHTPKF